MEKLQQQLMQLVQAAIQGDQKAQSTIQQIMTAAQQPGADQQTVQIAQFIVSLLQPESAKKGTKIKKKSLIPVKKCGNKVKKGELGLSSNRCKCMLKRVGGTIIEVDSCTGLPYRKSGGKVRKGFDGFSVGYNTADATTMNITGSEGLMHFYKDPETGQFMKQTWDDSNNTWGTAQVYNIDPSTDYKSGSDFIKYGYAKGYDPTEGAWGTWGTDETDRDDAIRAAESNTYIHKAPNQKISYFGADVVINPITKEVISQTNNKRYNKWAAKQIFKDRFTQAKSDINNYYDQMVKEIGENNKYKIDLGKQTTLGKKLAIKKYIRKDAKDDVIGGVANFLNTYKLNPSKITPAATTSAQQAQTSVSSTPTQSQNNTTQTQYNFNVPNFIDVTNK